MKKKIIGMVKAHKKTSAAVLGILIVALTWFWNTRSAAVVTQYQTITVAKNGAVVASVSGTGQVNAETTVDMKVNASGNVVYVGAVQGKTVKKGALLFKLDDTAARKSVRDAEISLQSAQLSLQKLQQPADTLTLLQAQHNLDSANESQTQARNSLSKAYDDGFNSVSGTFVDIPSIMADFETLLYSSAVRSSQSNIAAYRDMVYRVDESVVTYQQKVEDAHTAARNAFEKTQKEYATASRTASPSNTEQLIDDTYTLTQDVAELTKATMTYLNFVKDILVQQQMVVPSVMNSQLTQLNTFTNTTNGDLANLLNVKNTIQQSKTSLANAGRTIAENQEKLAETQAGTSDIDLKSQELSVQQRQYALSDAETTLADYYYYAPFDGVVASVAVSVGDSAGGATALGSLITHQSVASVPFNEVDAANVKVGQKAVLTFDALDSLTLVGEVASIDTVGTVSQGVVTYKATIAFDDPSAKVKPGMSVSATVITNTKTDVFSVPNTAIKSSGGRSTLQVLTNTGTADAPQYQVSQRVVQTGIVSDTDTEIVSGLQEGDQVIVQTTTTGGSTSATTARTTQSTILPTSGGGGNRNFGGGGTNGGR